MKLPYPESFFWQVVLPILAMYASTFGLVFGSLYILGYME